MTVLLVTHERKASPGRVEDLLHAQGVETQRCRPFAGEPLPDPTRFSGVVVFGGGMSSNDEHLPFIRAELDWIPTVLAAGTPYFGICLGAQLLARSLGAAVRRHEQGLHEIGFARITPTEAGRDVFGVPMHVYHWHGEGFAIPPGATRLASGEVFENQAFQYRHAIGVQFHPEVTPTIMARWFVDLADFHLPGAQPRESHEAAAPAYLPVVDRWLDGFLKRWLRPAKSAAAA